MLEPLAKIVRERKRVSWDASDTRHFIQAWLRRQMTLDQIYCERFSRGVATIRAPSPAVRMMAKLLEYDLSRALKTSGGPKLRTIKILQ